MRAISGLAPIAWCVTDALALAPTADDAHQFDLLILQAEARLPAITETVRPRNATVVAHGTAAELVLLLWGRIPPVSVTVTGDRAFLERFLEYPNLN